MSHSKLSIFFRAAALAWTLACAPLAAKADAIEDFFKAVTMDNADDVSSYLQQGMNPNVREKYRGSPGLVVAMQESSMKAFEVLVNAPNIDLEATADKGNNALMLAAYKGNQEAVNILLKHGVSVNRPNWTALHYAAAGGKNKIVRVLLDRGADINARSPNRTTPLMIAAYEGNFTTVQLLLERGADVTLKNSIGMNAADYAKRYDRNDIIELVGTYLKKAEQERLEMAYDIGMMPPSRAP